MLSSCLGPTPKSAKLAALVNVSAHEMKAWRLAQPSPVGQNSGSGVSIGVKPVSARRAADLDLVLHNDHVGDALDGVPMELEMEDQRVEEVGLLGF